MPEVMHLRLEEATLLELERASGASQQAQDSVEMLGVLSVRTGEHDDIIKIEEAYLPTDA